MGDACGTPTHAGGEMVGRGLHALGGRQGGIPVGEQVGEKERGREEGKGLKGEAG